MSDWIPGLKVGHAHCAVARSGVTVMVPQAPVVMAVDVRGGGPGTRETDALAPENLVERVHALVLSGGSVFGLAAADAVALALARAGQGLLLGEGADTLAVPVVPAAILFDLLNGGDKSWARAGGGDPPYARLAREALASLSDRPAHGPVGAAFGARAGSRPGGIGIAAARLDDGGTVAALVAVNSFGEVVHKDPPSDGEVPMPKRKPMSGLDDQATNTTLAVVATDRPLTRAAAKRLATMAHDGMARAIRPIHTPFDGDIVFALSTSPESPAGVSPVLLAELGTRAADCVTRAIRAAVPGP
ncbi:MAG: P1 family peptidase [Sphingomonadaceae bacterium]